MIDTLSYSKKLENVGFTKEQSEALVMLASELSFHHLATKEDLRQVQTELRSEMQALRSDVKNDILSIEHSLTLRLGIMMGTMFTVFFAALTFVIHIKA